MCMYPCDNKWLYPHTITTGEKIGQEEQGWVYGRVRKEGRKGGKREMMDEWIDG